MDLGLKDKKALVLGSTSGLGLAIAKQLLAEGANVVISGRDESKAENAANSSGIKKYVTGDLTISGQAKKMIDQAVEILGGLDIIVINTGGGTPGGILDVSDDAKNLAFASMLNSALEAARASAPHLMKAGNARMLFVTARSVVEATPELALSSVYRSGVAAAARSLAIEMAPDVLVNVIIPGPFDTPAYGKFSSWISSKEGISIDEVRIQEEAKIPLGRLGKAEEFADVVTFICSPRASYVNGSVIRVDGGAVKGFH